MPLDQKLVTRYAKFHALKNLLDKWLDHRRADVLLGMGARLNPTTKRWEATDPAPDRGPYLLELGDAEAGVKWKEEFRAHLIRAGYTESGADAELQKIADKERERQPRLYCKVNPNYRRKFEIRLPA